MKMYSGQTTDSVKRSVLVRKTLGMSLAEYGLIMGLVVIVAIPALTMMGTQTRDNINQVSQNSNQFNQIANLLNEPVSAGAAHQSGHQPKSLQSTNSESSSSQASDFPASANKTSTTVVLGGQNFAPQLGADGKIRFIANSGDSTNTTAVDGNQMTQMALAELQQILNSPTSELSIEEKSDLDRLILHAKNIVRQQASLDESLELQPYRKGQSQINAKNELGSTLEATKGLIFEASKFEENPQVTVLAQAITTIAYQNYLTNTTLNNKLHSAGKAPFRKETLEEQIPPHMLLTGISTEANHTDTQAATNELKTLNRSALPGG